MMTDTVTAALPATAQVAMTAVTSAATPAATTLQNGAALLDMVSLRPGQRLGLQRHPEFGLARTMERGLARKVAKCTPRPCRLRCKPLALQSLALHPLGDRRARVPHVAEEGVACKSTCIIAPVHIATPRRAARQNRPQPPEVTHELA